MIVNHNINAVNTYNRLNFVGKSKSNAMEKLASGMRINKAADDAAGATISQEMKAQIRGLEQAGRNIQDGISLVQTAEAGLGSIQNPNLQRMRELMVQALNGTLTQQDRMQIQNELENVKASIDDIANDTEFNTIKVLSPPAIKSSTPAGTGKADIVLVVDNTGSMASAQVTIANNINNFISSLASSGVTDVRIGIMEYKDNSINKIDFSGSKWTSNPSEVSTALIDISATNSGGTENTMWAITEAANYYDFRENGTGEKNKHIIFITNESGDDNGNAGATETLLQNSGIELSGVYYSNDSTFSTFNNLVNSTGGKYVNLAESNWGANLSTILGQHIGSSAGVSKQEEDKMPTLSLQVGANSGQEFKVELFDARTKNLGINDVKVDTIEEAEKSLEKVDKAIELVSHQRSKFGAYQNALEHIAKNVDNYGYNVSAAESRISDADMAKETMEMTKSSIIEQSAQAILKQAEKMPESIINLMDKWQGNSSNQ